jgi:hypothetical protein
MNDQENVHVGTTSDVEEFKRRLLELYLSQCRLPNTYAFEAHRCQTEGSYTKVANA